MRFLTGYYILTQILYADNILGIFTTRVWKVLSLQVCLITMGAGSLEKIF